MLPLVLWLALVGFICLVLKEPLHEGEGVTIGVVTVVLFVIPAFVAYWQDISQISMGSGFLRVRLKNKRVAFYKKQFSSIPNGHAFLHLCRQYHSAR